MFITFVTFIHVIICLFLIAVVLLQQGKGADMGATFGGGSQTLFGASGADNLLSRLTTGAAITFMVTSVLLASNTRDVGVTGSNLFKDRGTTGATGTQAPVTAPLESAPAQPANPAPAAPSQGAPAPAEPAPAAQ